jgi:hypothetical protein
MRRETDPSVCGAQASRSRKRIRVDLSIARLPYRFFAPRWQARCRLCIPLLLALTLGNGLVLVQFLGVDLKMWAAEYMPNYYEVVMKS